MTEHPTEPASAAPSVSIRRDELIDEIAARKNDIEDLEMELAQGKSELEDLENELWHIDNDPDDEENDNDR